jgi:hypothetical protein
MNTAGRLLSTYDRLVVGGRPNDLPMVKVWADVFGCSPDSPNLEDEVVACLQALRSEMDLLRSKLLAMGAPEELMQPGMKRFRNVASTAYINTGWNGLREELARPENRLALLWASWTLREEDEAVVSDENLAALTGELVSLEQSLRDTEISPFLRDFIQKQIDTIRSALRLYPVKGAAPVRRAVEAVGGAYALQKAKVDSECEKTAAPARSLISRFGTALRRTTEIAKDFRDLTEAGGDLIEASKAVLDALPFSG